MSAIGANHPAWRAAGVPTGFRRIGLGRWTVLVSVRSVLAVAVLVVALAVALGASLAFGSAGIDPLAALLALAGFGDSKDVFVVRKLRLFRAEAGILVGLALGMSGCLLQTLARNRLATPDTTGIASGATAFAVASVIAASTSMAPSMMSLAGAAVAAALAFALAGGAGDRGYRFIVVGIGVGQVFGSVTNLMLARAPIDSANAAYPWTVGSLNARPSGPVLLLLAGLALCLPLGFALARELSLMRLPDAVAQGLGVRVKPVRAGAIGVAVVAASLAIAVAGPVGMIAFVAPEAARRLAGARVVPIVGAALAGALFVLVADLAGRTLMSPIEVPVGVVASVVGGPYLLWVLVRAPSRRMP